MATATLAHPCASACPALFISAPASGQGKTTVTAALARYHRNLGRKVRVFKTGPDFLDPMILEQASGNPVYQLDLWMCGEAHCRELLHAAACDADLILIEGVMGLFDGTPSSADLATHFGIPVLAVIDGSAMAQTFGAIAHGLASYRSELPFAGVLANRIGSEGHYQMLAESLPDSIKPFGWLARNGEITLPERHLGIVQASEIADLDARIESAANALNEGVTALPKAITFPAGGNTAATTSLKGLRIAVARDAAFGFIYHANIDTLTALGAEIEYFSPIADHKVPEADALYLPGGYPELHLDALTRNKQMMVSIHAHHGAHKPILAECGGMLYLFETLTDSDGNRAEMTGLLPGHGVMQRQLSNLGLQSVQLPEGELRGHTFHHSLCECALMPLTETHPSRHHGKSEAVYRHGRLTASYLHLYFPSNAEAVARLFQP